MALPRMGATKRKTDDNEHPMRELMWAQRAAATRPGAFASMGHSWSGGKLSRCCTSAAAWLGRKDQVPARSSPAHRQVAGGEQRGQLLPGRGLGSAVTNRRRSVWNICRGQSAELACPACLPLPPTAPSS